MVPSGVGGQRPLFGMVATHPVTTNSVLHQAQTIHSMIPQMNPIIKREPMDMSPTVSTKVAANLYLCDSGSASSKEQLTVEPNASVDILDKEHLRLVQTKIKDSLSSFVPDIPGEFDSSNNPESMLRTLIDRPPIGGREFLPLSDQSLMGFRLHPGPLPEQYRLDPLALAEPHKHHKKKKKHKHRHVDKAEETSLSNYSPPVSREQSPPSDPCDFIKPENTPNFFPPVPPQRPAIHHPPPPQPTPQPHLLQGNPSSISAHSPTTIPMAPFLNMNIVSSSSMAIPQSVIVGNKVSSAYSHIPAYVIPGAGAASILSTAGKQKKKRHNVEGAEGGAPKKKKKKEKDKDKNREKKKRRHHNPDGTPMASLAAVSTSSTVATALPSLSMPPSFPGIHPSGQ